MKTIMISSLIGVILALPAHSQEQPKPDNPPAQPEQQEKDRAKDRNNELLAKREQTAEPTASHRNLEGFVGTWQVTGQAWKDGSGQPESMTGICTADWVLGRRFVKSHAQGTVGSRPFEGYGVCGYDAGEKKYTEMWIDNMSTGTKATKGDYDAKTKTFTYTGEFKDEKGQAVKCRKVVKVVSETEHVATTYATMGGKEEVKVLEMTFKRTTAKTGQKGTDEKDAEKAKSDVTPKK